MIEFSVPEVSFSKLEERDMKRSREESSVQFTLRCVKYPIVECQDKPHYKPLDDVS